MKFVSIFGNDILCKHDFVNGLKHIVSSNETLELKFYRTQANCRKEVYEQKVLLSTERDVIDFSKDLFSPFSQSFFGGYSSDMSIT